MSEEKVLTLRGKKAVWAPAPAGVGGGGLLFEVADSEQQSGTSGVKAVVTKNYDPLYEALMEGKSVVIKMTVDDVLSYIVPSICAILNNSGLMVTVPVLMPGSTNNQVFLFANGSYHSV